MNPFEYAPTAGQPTQVADESPSERFAQSRSFRMFCSYRGGYESDTIGFLEQVETFGVVTFMAKRDIPVGAVWDIEIERAISMCDALLAYCPATFGDATWTNREVELAEKHQKPIRPIWTEGRPRGPVTRYQALILSETSDPAMDIVNGLTNHRRMTEALVSAIEKCAIHGNFELANRLAIAFAKITYMSELQADRLIETHNQIVSHDRFGYVNQIRSASHFSQFTSRPNESIITVKINELSPRLVLHGTNGDIISAPPLGTRRPDQTIRPSFTREVNRNQLIETRHSSDSTSQVTGTSEPASVLPW